MANDFAEKIDIFFDNVVAGFEALNQTAGAVSMYRPNAGDLANTAQTFYRPMPVQTSTVDGRDMTSEYLDLTELTVPSTLTESHIRNVPVKFTGTDLNNERMLRNKERAAVTQLSNKVDTIVANAIAANASIVVTQATAMSTYEDLAQAETRMLKEQAARGERCMILSPDMSRVVSSNIANRETMNDPVLAAYQRSQLIDVGGFDTMRADYTKTLIGSSGSGYLVNGADQNTSPVSNDANGVPVDNRKQTLTVDTGSNAAVGDCFTIAGVNAVGHINKQDTGDLKTFRITAISGNDWTITPAIIPADGTDDAQKAYGNVTTTPADNAAITILNTVSKPVSVFYEKDAVEIIHADWNMEEFRASGKSVRTAATDSGIQIAMLSDSNIDTLAASYRMFVWCNAEVLNPELAGILLEGQT